MAANSDIRYRQTLDNSQFKKGLKESQSLGQKFGNQIKSIGPMIAGAFAVGAVMSFVKSSIEGIHEIEKANAALLNSMQGRRDITDRLIAQNKELASTTLFRQADITGGESMLSVFTRQEDQLKKLMPLVMDFATKFQMDLPSAAKMVGKALVNVNGTIGKTGIKVGGAADSVDRFNNLMDVLTDKVGGASIAAAETNAGKVEMLGKAWASFGRTLVESIGPALTGIAKGLTEVTKAADTFLSNKDFTFISILLLSLTNFALRHILLTCSEILS